MAEPGAGVGGDTDNDIDSTFGPGSPTSSTTTLSSSILKYRTENGRRYHAYKAGRYLFPNDKEEQDRLDLQHHLFLLTFEGKLHTCQFGGKILHRVLDIGTGTGIWAIDFADEHPEAQVFAIDLSPIQPTFVPPNLTFEVDDVEQPWMFSNKFDFIYIRTMARAIRDWPRLYEQCFENLTERGFIEVVDICFPPKVHGGGLLPDESRLKEWADLLVEATTACGCPIDSAKSHKSQLQAAGFVDIVEDTKYWPQNRWPKAKEYKELGNWTLENLQTGLEGYTLAALTRGLAWTKEEVYLLCTEVRKEMRDVDFPVYWEISVVSAQKP